MVSAVMGSQRVPTLENFLAKVARKRGQPGEEDDTYIEIWMIGYDSPG